MEIYLLKKSENDIQIIKLVRIFTKLRLKEAKYLIDQTPILLMKGVRKERAERIKKAFEEIGALVDVRNEVRTIKAYLAFARP